MRTALRVQFPDHQGKYREIRRFGLGLDVLSFRNCSEHRYFFSEFPKIRNRELFSKSREVSRKIRESDRRIRVAPRNRAHSPLRLFRPSEGGLSLKAARGSRSLRPRPASNPADRDDGPCDRARPSPRTLEEAPGSASSRKPCPALDPTDPTP